MQLVYKRVAVVELFFSIIYRSVFTIFMIFIFTTLTMMRSVHVESDGDTPHLRGRAGKHCGQKRTYRAVSQGYGLHFPHIFPFKDGFKVRACEVCSMLSGWGTGERIYGPEEKVL